MTGSNGSGREREGCRATPILLWTDIHVAILRDHSVFATVLLRVTMAGRTQGEEGCLGDDRVAKCER